MDYVKARMMNECIADWEVRWTDRFMPLGRMTDWIDSFVNEWIIGCLGD